MGHSDPAESCIHSPQHDSAPSGEGPHIHTPTLYTVLSSQAFFKL